MEIIRISVIGIAGIVLAILVKEAKPEYSFYLTFAAGIAILFFSAGRLSDLLGSIREIQQYLPIAGIWDVGYVVDEIREFYRESEGIADTIPYIGEIRAAGSFALRGYLIAIILFIPFWIRILFFKVKRKVVMNEKIYWKK